MNSSLNVKFAGQCRGKEWVVGYSLLFKKIIFAVTCKRHICFGLTLFPAFVVSYVSSACQD